MKKPTTLLRFPCSYPLKVVGRNANKFHASVSAIIERHVTQGEKVVYSTRLSSQDKYMSITATFTANSREQLSAIYEELNSHDLVLITL